MHLLAGRRPRGDGGRHAVLDVVGVRRDDEGALPVVGHRLRGGHGRSLPPSRPHGQGNRAGLLGAARVPIVGPTGRRRPGGGTRREGPSHRAGALAACGLLGVARATRSLARRTAATGSDAGTVTRLTAAAVVSYLLTLVLTEGAIDLTGALTALLVVQATAYSTRQDGRRPRRRRPVRRPRRHPALQLVRPDLVEPRRGDRRLAGAGKVLRLGEQTLEVPITAMLILGVTNHDIAAEIRILNTLIGPASASPST